MKTPPPYPSVYPQNPNDSIASAGKYDFQHFSNAEIKTIHDVLDTTEDKYPSKYRGIGLAMEAYSIVYKARYVLHEIIIILYEKSNRPLDKLAVGLAYQTKGAFYYNCALSLIEPSMKHISHRDFVYIRNVFPIWYLYNKISDLCEHERRYADALKYAALAAKNKAQLSPYDFLHPGQIYRKIDISLSVQYYEKILKRKEARPYITMIDKEYIKAKELKEKGYVYHPRCAKQPAQDADFEKRLHQASLEILQSKEIAGCGGGKFEILSPLH